MKNLLLTSLAVAGLTGCYSKLPEDGSSGSRLASADITIPVPGFKGSLFVQVQPGKTGTICDEVGCSSEEKIWQIETTEKAYKIDDLKLGKGSTYLFRISGKRPDGTVIQTTKCLTKDSDDGEAFFVTEASDIRAAEVDGFKYAQQAVGSENSVNVKIPICGTTDDTTVAGGGNVDTDIEVLSEVNYEVTMVKDEDSGDYKANTKTANIRVKETGKYDQLVLSTDLSSLKCNFSMTGISGVFEADPVRKVDMGSKNLSRFYFDFNAIIEGLLGDDGPIMRKDSVFDIDILCTAATVSTAGENKEYLKKISSEEGASAISSGSAACKANDFANGTGWVNAITGDYEALCVKQEAVSAISKMISVPDDMRDEDNLEDVLYGKNSGKAKAQMLVNALKDSAAGCGQFEDGTDSYPAGFIYTNEVVDGKFGVVCLKTTGDFDGFVYGKLVDYWKSIVGVD